MDLRAYIIPSIGMIESTIPRGSQNGFISKDHYRNPTVTVNGHILRERSELLLIKDSCILLQRKDPWENNDYKIPGGATDPDLTVVETAIKECEEEALIIPTNVKYFGVYCILFDDKNPVPKWLQNRNNEKFPIDYDGYYTHVCVGQYSKPYKDRIDEEDKDDFYSKAKWIPIEKAKKFLRKEHVDALNQYLLSGI